MLLPPATSSCSSSRQRPRHQMARLREKRGGGRRARFACRHALPSPACLPSNHMRSRFVCYVATPRLLSTSVIPSAQMMGI